MQPYVILLTAVVVILATFLALYHVIRVLSRISVEYYNVLQNAAEQEHIGRINRVLFDLQSRFDQSEHEIKAVMQSSSRTDRNSADMLVRLDELASKTRRDISAAETRLRNLIKRTNLETTTPAIPEPEEPSENGLQSLFVEK